MSGRKHKAPEHANHERWLVSYADFITLLFAFFVVMYAVSEIDKRKMVDLSDAIIFALGRPGHDRSMQPQLHALGGESPLSARSEEDAKSGALMPEGERKELIGLLDRMEREMVPIDRTGAFPDGVELELTDRGLLIRLAQINFFDAGGATLRPEAFLVLDALGGHLLRAGRRVSVEGHSDATGLGGQSAHTTNWELAANRALSVVRYLHEATKLPPGKLAVSTFGQYRPVADNSTPEGRAKNRRIDIYVRPKNDHGGPLKRAHRDGR